MNKLLLFVLCLFLGMQVNGQFVGAEGDTLYGNEWINFDQSYFKIPVAEDGMYRITGSELEEAGIPISDIDGSNFQMFHNGQAYPIYLSTSSTLSESDFIEFYGQKNRGDLDKIFYENWEEMQLNPEYSLFTDTAAYFLTWNNGSGNLRVTEEITDLTDNFLPVEEYYIHKEKVVLSNRLNKPTRQGGDNVRYSHFDIGEGFGGALSKKNTVTVPATRIFGDGPNPSLDIRFTTNATAHIIECSINGDLKETYTHNEYQLRQERINFDLDELNSTNQIVLEGTVDNFDRNAISVVELNYPREFNFDDEDYFEFYAEGSLFENYVEIRNFELQGDVFIYDPETGIRITPVIEDGFVKFIVPGANDARNLVIYNTDEGLNSISEIEESNFTNYSEIEGEYIIISHPNLMEGPVNQVQAYADYRSSSQGGSYKTVVADVTELYDQFSYGISRHSYSVKNFVNYLSKEWTNPRYVFIIGKGREYGVYRSESQIEDPIHRTYYVPTFGLPGSDNLLVSKGNIKTAHQIPTGRLAAKDVDDIEIYLEKVKEHESFGDKPQTIGDKLWKKRIMHLAGAETSLQESIGSYLETMEVEIETSQYGAEVTTFKKSSTETIQEADADALLETIDAGLSILTFFGHSSVGTFDFNIDDVNKLKNFGKYPLVVSLGCFSGNIHTQSYGISEQYVLTGQKGAIAFMASSSTAYVTPQGNFGIDYYTKLGNEYYGQSLGETFASSLKEKDNLTGIHSKILNEQMTLHGDPAIRLSDAVGPDYVYDHSSFTTDPSIVESNTAEFDLTFRVANLGRFEVDSLSVDLSHIKSDGSVGSEKSFRIPAPRFDTLITVTFENGDNANVGRNLILGTLDEGNSISEIPNPAAEDNNSIVDDSGEEGFSFFTINNSAIPVSPCDFGIYNEQDVILRASTYNAIASEATNYVFELDTTGLFDSPIKQRYEVSSIGGLLEWEPDFNFENGKSYYWRISPDSISTEIGYKWEDASFVYLPNSSNGWNQSHHYQYLDNDFDGIYIDQESRKFEFDTSGFFIKVFNSVWDPNITGYQFDFEAYALSVRPWNFMQEGIAIVVGDSRTGSGWINSGGDYGSINTSNLGSFRTFGFLTDTPENRAKVINMLENEIPDESFVWFFTVLRTLNSDFKPELWADDNELLGNDIFTILEDQGAVLVRDLEIKGSVPYTFVYQKGVDKITEEIGEDIESLITSTAFIPIRSNEGAYESSLIGPAQSWDRILLKKGEDSSLDTTRINIIGVNEDGNDILLHSQLAKSEIDISNIDATLFPHLKIRFQSIDKENLTPSQLDFWRVLYKGYPDIGLKTSDGFVFNRDTLQQGEDLTFSILVENISEYDVDTANIEILITDATNQNLTFQEKVSFLDQESQVFSFTFNTTGMLGSYQISININGDRSFVEKTYVNNFGVREFVVIGDKLNPILEVSFDGNKIIDGDIVSPKPIINIELVDENEFLLLNDPSLFELAILSPDGSEEIISHTDERITFFGATDSQDNRARIEFKPEFLEDGIYTFEVRASDRSENISGDFDYIRSFEVINEQMISNVLNYPNPFSTSTEFIFTLTGSEVPNELKIQILSVSGKVVKEIFKEELGLLKIGVNRTSYKWDGTDDYGNKLANGVYLYRVTSSHNGELLDKYSIQEISSNFKNNLGKMVILR